MDNPDDSLASTLWAVNDQSTALLAERFYRHWKGDGMAPPEALAAAQRWLRDEADGGRWAHPHYWAGFTLTGVSLGALLASRREVRRT